MKTEHTQSGFNFEKSIVRNLLCFLCYIFITVNSFAQDSLNLEKYYPKPKITAIEFFIGPSLVGINGNEETPKRYGQAVFVNPLDNKLAYTIGVGITHSFTKLFQIKIKLTWEQKGYIRSLDTLSFDNNFIFISKNHVWSENISNNYISLLVLPQITFGDKANFNIGVGGYLSSLSSSNTHYTGQTTFTYLSDQNYNKYDFGLSINAGYSYPLKEILQLTVQLTACYGLYPISDRFVSFNYPKWYNSSYSILFGVRLIRKAV